MSNSPNAVELDKAIRCVARQRNIKNRVAELQRVADAPCLKRALTYAYDPFIRFGVAINGRQSTDLMAKVSVDKPGLLDITDSEIWEMLDDLRVSTASSATKMEILGRIFERVNFITAVIIRSILEKSLINGVAVSTVNKAFPGLIKVFGVQLASKFTDRKVKNYPVWVEPKYDGMRATTVVHKNGDIEVMTRTGRDIPAASYFHKELLLVAQRYKKMLQDDGKEYNGVILDGELLGETFNDTVSIFRKGKAATSGTYHVFDLLPLDVLSGDIKSDRYEDRLATINRICFDDLTTVGRSPAYQARSSKEVWDIYYKSRASGYEGVIVKDKDGLWQPKRSNVWLKIKAEETLDLTVIGAFEGEGEFEGTLGGLIVEFEGNEVRVGSGFDRVTRDVIWSQFLDDLDKSISDQDDFYLIGTTIEVQYQEITPAKSLRHPVFIRRRLDKDRAAF